MTLPLLRTQCYVDGAWIDGARTIAVDDPATGAVIAEVPDLDDAGYGRAIDAAARAFPAWRAASAATRSGHLARLGAAMRARERDLGALITAENGKPLAEAIAEVRYAASFVDWYAAEALRVYGETIPAPRADQRVVVEREPVGPCALITPWNFPAAMLARKLAPALAAGCTVVARPASQTPLTALALARLVEEAGVPAGVVNVVTGEARRFGALVTGDARIRKLSFTGSTEVGRELAAAAARHLQRCSLELGGNAPLVVFADADLARTTAAALVAKLRNTGQSCVAANRFIVAASVADDLVARLVAGAAGVELGPLIDDRAVAKVRRLVEDALARGARLVAGAVPDGGSRRVAPIVLTGITREMQLWREEIFGPVIAVTTFTDEAEAIALANDTEYGLVAYVFTEDRARAERAVRAIEAGMVGVNEGLVSYAHAPFGGVKQSGYGREGGRAGLEEYLSPKYVMLTSRE